MKKKLLKKHSVAEYVLVAPKYFKKISIKKKSRIFVGHRKDGHWTDIKIILTEVFGMKISNNFRRFFVIFRIRWG